MKILVADDSPPTRIALASLVEKWGAEVVTAEDGLQAWMALSSKEPPRVAILDWMMPKLDGVEVCRRLHERAGGQFIYVILLTSKSETCDLVHALDNGAHDFLSKPVHPQELRSRIDVGKRLVTADDKLSDYAANMEKLAEDRARQLVHADRLATLGTLSASVAHEIKNPLACIAGNTDLLQLYWQALAPALRGEEIGPDKRKNVEESLTELPNMLTDMKTAVQRMTGILNELTRFSRKGSHQQGKASLHAPIESALRLCGRLFKNKVKIETALMSDPPLLLLDAQKMEQVFINLLANAADALSETGGGTIHVRTSAEGTRLTAIVEDDGPGIPSDSLDKIWAPFYTTKAEGKGTGLGLAIVQGIVKEHGGHIRVENRPEGGARFTIELPFPPA